MDRKLCDQCKGEGTIRKNTHYGDWEEDTCSKCEGVGMVFSRTYTLEMPISKYSEYLKKDREIIETIRRS